MVQVSNEEGIESHGTSLMILRVLPISCNIVMGTLEVESETGGNS